jgi:hypothetical protein
MIVLFLVAFLPLARREPPTPHRVFIAIRPGMRIHIAAGVETESQVDVPHVF